MLCLLRRKKHEYRWYEKVFAGAFIRLHDVAHEFDEQANLVRIKKYDLPREYLNVFYRNILHSVIESCVVKELFFFDGAMCQAVKYHTIGNKDMSTFDKIIFIADKVGRKNLDNGIKR